MTGNKNIRQSQLISPWGVGQIIPFPDESLMVAGLDAWEGVYGIASNKEAFILQEARLEKRLNVNHFRFPPEYRNKDKDDVNVGLRIPFVRFPRWHYCNSCGYMELVTIYKQDRSKCIGPKYITGRRPCLNLSDAKKPYIVPIRFISVCIKGHIEDFPFLEWVHNKKNKVITAECNLRFQVSGSTTALDAIKIHCIHCNIYVSMKGSIREGSLRNIKQCSGQRPWLGEVDDEAKGCGEDLIVVQRGAANVYFPNIKSSIYIPAQMDHVNEQIEKVLENNWYKLCATTNGELDEERFKAIAVLYNVDFAELLKAGEKRIKDTVDLSSVPEEKIEEDYRRAEFEALTNHSRIDIKDFLVTETDIKKYDPKFNNYINKVALVEKLRETRALVGFSRVYPEDGKNLSEKKKELFKGNNIQWLPAINVKGEGIFLQFNDKLLESWEKKEGITERVKTLENKYNASREFYKLPYRTINPRLILLHTISHSLINRISIQCGYGSSSLRERIYCNIQNKNEVMNGILIYTASGDSEGSLGGLVRQGNPGYMERIFFEAIEDVKWCSSDPICIESPGQGPGSCNLAACHHCCLLPETSCEESNRLLDRGLLIGTINKPELGFFV